MVELKSHLLMKYGNAFSPFICFFVCFALSFLWKKALLWLGARVKAIFHRQACKS